MLEEAKAKIQRYLITKTDFLKIKDKLDENQLRDVIKRAIEEVSMKEEYTLSDMEKDMIIRSLVDSVITLGPIRQLMADPEVSEIMINGANTIYIQRNGRITLSEVKFDDNHQLLNMVQRILMATGSGRRVDESSPYVDFSLADGSRVNVIVSPVSLLGPVVTIRKFSPTINKIEDLLERRMINQEMADFLIAAIKAKLNIVFCGATGTGKTTTLNVLSRYIPNEERIITIEDTAELRLLQDHVVPLQAKAPNIEGKGAISIRDLFVNSLRMRPDRIIIGEVRNDECLDFIQAISSGHTGSLAIIHADSPTDCFNRMVTMIMMSGVRLSVEEIRRQIAQAVDLIVHTELFIDGTRKLTYVTDVKYTPDDGKISLEDVFYYNQQKIDEKGKVIGEWIKSKTKPSCYPKFVKRNVKLPEGFFA